MSLEFACPYCEEISKVPDSYAGKRGKCPKCGKVIEVPDPAAFEDAPAEPAPAVESPQSGPKAGEAFGEPVSGDTKPCTFCGEHIKRVAKKCKFCGEFLDRRLKRRRGGGRRGPRPENHLIYAILVTLFCSACFWPIGVVGIVYASQVDSKWAAGDYIGARAASRSAKTWTTVTLGLTSGAVILYIFIALLSL